MIRKITFYLNIIFLVACGANQNMATYTKPETAIEAGSGFLKAINEGNFIVAKQYMVENNTNGFIADSIETAYRSLNRDGREALRTASINIISIKDSLPTVTFIKYSNTYNKTVNILPIINKNDIWQIDYAIR